MGFAAGDMNLRRYVGNNPLNHTDPTGLMEEFSLGDPRNLINLGNTRPPNWSGLQMSATEGVEPSNPNFYSGTARPGLTVRDMMDYFFSMPNGTFTLYVLGNHRLNDELRGTDYVKQRFQDLKSVLQNKAQRNDASDGSTTGIRRADIPAFLREMPTNIQRGLYQVMEKVVRVKVADYPLLNYLGSYRMTLYYKNVNFNECTADVLVKVTNDTTWASFTRIPGTTLTVVNTKANFQQIYEWTERVKFKGKSNDPLEPPALGTPSNPFGNVNW